MWASLWIQTIKFSNDGNFLNWALSLIRQLLFPGKKPKEIIQDGDDVDESEPTSVFSKTKENDTVAEDSDEEEEEAPVEVKPKKKIVKKVVAEAVEAEAEV